MSTAHFRKHWIAFCLWSSVAMVASGQEYQFQIDQPSSGGNAQLRVKATTDGTLIGNYDSVTNTGGTRTKPGTSSPGATENLPVPVNSFNPDANGTVVFSPSGSFRLNFDIAAGSVTLADFSTSLLGGNTASLPVNAAVSLTQFRTASPSNWYIAASTNVGLGNAVVSQLSATQVPGSVIGTLTPIGGDQYSFSITPMVILQANVTFQGSPMDLPSDPMPFPLAGSVTLLGNTATLIESAPVNLTNNTAPNQAMDPIPYDLPGMPFPLGSGQASHVIFNLILRTTQTTVAGTQSLNANGVVIFPTWTGTQSSAWSAATNWSATVPNGANAVARFASSTAPRDINLDVPVTVGTIEFSADQPYTVAGSNSVTFSSSGTGKLSVLAGPSTGHTIAAPVVAKANLDIDVASGTALNLPQGLTIAPGITVAKTANTGSLHLGPVAMQSPASRLIIGAGQTSIGHITSGQLDIGNGAAVTLDASLTPSTLDGLIVQGSGTLDLAGNDVSLNYTGSAPYSTFAQLVRQHAIFSSQAPAVGTAAVALVDNAMLHIVTWHGQSISDGVNFSQLLLVSTCAGDNNLDGIVDAADYRNVIAHMGKTNATWFDGDLDGDSVVTVSDVALVTQNMGAGAVFAVTPANQVASVGMVAVPEPAGLGLLGVGAVSLLFRQRRAKAQ